MDFLRTHSPTQKVPYLKRTMTLFVKFGTWLAQFLYFSSFGFMVRFYPSGCPILSVWSDLFNLFFHPIYTLFFNLFLNQFFPIFATGILDTTLLSDVVCNLWSEIWQLVNLSPVFYPTIASLSLSRDKKRLCARACTCALSVHVSIPPLPSLSIAFLFYPYTVLPLTLHHLRTKEKKSFSSFPARSCMKHSQGL